MLLKEKKSSKRLTGRMIDPYQKQKKMSPQKMKQFLVFVVLSSEARYVFILLGFCYPEAKIP